MPLRGLKSQARGLTWLKKSNAQMPSLLPSVAWSNAVNLKLELNQCSFNTSVTQPNSQTHSIPSIPLCPNALNSTYTPMPKRPHFRDGETERVAPNQLPNLRFASFFTVARLLQTKI